MAVFGSTWVYSEIYLPIIECTIVISPYEKFRATSNFQNFKITQDFYRSIRFFLERWKWLGKFHTPNPLPYISFFYCKHSLTPVTWILQWNPWKIDPQITVLPILYRVVPVHTHHGQHEFSPHSRGTHFSYGTWRMWPPNKKLSPQLRVVSV